MTSTRGVGALDAPQGLVDELFDRAEAHRERQGDDGGAGEPDRLQRGDERARRRADDGDVRSRLHAVRLERGSHGTCFIVELAPLHAVDPSLAGRGADEGDGSRALRCSFKARGDGSHREFDSLPGLRVTSR